MKTELEELESRVARRLYDLDKQHTNMEDTMMQNYNNLLKLVLQMQMEIELLKDQVATLAALAEED